MAKSLNSPEIDSEIAAMGAVVKALDKLDKPAKQRVINYVSTRFELVVKNDEQPEAESQGEQEVERIRDMKPSTPGIPPQEEPDGLEGINPVAKKWMSRNGLNPDAISKLFSLGIEDIDLVAQNVPGDNKKDRMRSVILLKSVASYLSSGAARVTHKQVKETCLHYDAFDGNNFAKHLKDLNAEVSGTKEAGYTLTARGLTDATTLVKSMVETAVK